jgi:hypothetical protein
MDWTYCTNGYRKNCEKDKGVETNCIKETEVQMGRSCQSGFGKIKTQNWSKMALDTEKWKTIVEQVKTHKEL